MILSEIKGRPYFTVQSHRDLSKIDKKQDFDTFSGQICNFKSFDFRQIMKFEVQNDKKLTIKIFAFHRSWYFTVRSCQGKSK